MSKQVDGWMDGWMDGCWMDGWMCGWINGWVDEWVDGWMDGMGCPALEVAGRWVELGLSIEMEISGRALTDWYYMGPGGLWWSIFLNSALPLQMLRPDTQPEHQDPVSHTAYLLSEPRNGWSLLNDLMRVVLMPLLPKLRGRAPLGWAQEGKSRRPSPDLCCGLHSKAWALGVAGSEVAHFNTFWPKVTAGF